ncbi:MAG: rhodanese-like domain-containing protein [Candidatus Saccharimonadales bacterium]
MKVIDVRSKSEYDRQHVNGALWFDVERIAAGEMPDVPRDEEIVLYCRSGARSSAAMYIMQQHGFTNVTSGGGLANMAARGYELVR